MAGNSDLSQLDGGLSLWKKLEEEKKKTRGERWKREEAEMKLKEMERENAALRRKLAEFIHKYVSVMVLILYD